MFYFRELWKIELGLRIIPRTYAKIFSSCRWSLAFSVTRCCPEVRLVVVVVAVVVGARQRQKRKPHDYVNPRIRVVHVTGSRRSVTGLPVAIAVVRSATAVPRVGRVYTPGVRHTARAANITSEPIPMDRGSFAIPSTVRRGRTPVDCGFYRVCAHRPAHANA